VKISIFGLGYVGAVSAGCLAKEKHLIIGVDPNQTKVDLINQGNTPVIEQDIGEIIEQAVANKLLRATTDVDDAIRSTDISLICVGTPSQNNGNLDLKYVEAVCEEIGLALREKQDFHIVVTRSTMLPGSMNSVVIPALENASGKKAGTDFGVCNNPEFLREGTAVYDFYHPPKTVIGETDGKSGSAVAKLYEKMDAPLIRTDVKTAEMVKYVDNVWHALKVGFANEIGNICKQLKLDGHKVMDIFCQDQKLNLSSYYLKPGFAFGGSCLPKDVRALTYKGQSLDLNLPILNAILPSNQLQIEAGINMVIEAKHKNIGILGMSFKAGTDDLRESPIVELIERLLGKGYNIQIYDKNVNLAALMGANKDYILNHIPHISKLLSNSIDEVLNHSNTIVIGNGDKEFNSLRSKIKPNQTIIDLVRLSELGSTEARYHGICW
jgi:GDP-mannose 6-dehydrogenase